MKEAEPSVQIKISIATKDKEGAPPSITSKKLVLNFSEVKGVDLDVEVIKLLEFIDKNEKLIGVSEWPVQ